MESDDYKVPDNIIQLLFANDKMKKGSKELLESFINSKMENKNTKETLKLILESFKAVLFDINTEYKNNIIRGDITPITCMLEIIQKYDPEPELNLILLKPLFNLYQPNLEQKQIKNLTERLTNFLKNKTKIILQNFNDLFEILIFLKVNQDQELRNYGVILDKFLKDSLQNYSDNIDTYKDCFDFDSFCNKINEKLSSQQYVIISLLVNWIGTICQIRKEAVVKFFQENILPWIFKLQMGIARDVSKNADKCFKTIKLNIDQNFSLYYRYDKKSMEEILSVIIKEASPKSNKISIPAWELLNLFLEKSEKHLDFYLKKEKDKKNLLLNKNTISLALEDNNLNKNEIKESNVFKGMKSKSSMSLPENFENKDNRTNNTKNFNFSSNNYSINTNNEKNGNKKVIKATTIKNPGGPSFEFKNLSKRQEYMNEFPKDNPFNKDDDILEYIPFGLFYKLLILITETYSQEIENKELIIKLNDTLKRIVDKSPNEIIKYGFIPIDITNIILIGMKNPANKKKGSFLEWCNILYKKYNKEMFKDFSIFIKEFIQAMPSNESDTFMDMVTFLSNIKMERDITNITMKYLTEKLMKEPELMNNMSYIIIILEHLTKNSSLAVIYESLADVLKDIKNFPFVSKLIDYLNQFLMRNPLGVNFRKSLINNEGKEKYNELFVKMYNIWSINSISLIIFCVITEHFELAYNIILNLVKVQLDNDYYIHLGTLVQLLESELYDYIRIRLLEPSNNIYLVRTLYGILMLLPQGQAFNVLSNRMSNVQTLFEIENGFNNIKVEEDNNEEIGKFIEIFLNNQKIKREDEENRNKNKLNL